MKRTNREKLKVMSKDVFGASSKWQHMVEDGWLQPQADGSKRWKPMSLRTVYKAMRRILDERSTRTQENNDSSATTEPGGISGSDQARSGEVTNESVADDSTTGSVQGT